MQTIFHAAEVLRRLHAADPGAVKRLLECSSVLNDAAARIPGTVTEPLTSPPILTGIGLINTLMEALFGDTIRVEGLHDSPEHLVISAHSRSPVVSNFDPGQGFEGTWDAVDYCRRQPQPCFAMEMVAAAALAQGEKGWVAEFLAACPDTWTPPSTDVLEMVIKFFCDMRCSWERPGYLRIQHKGIDFAFGADNPSDYPADLEAQFVMFDYALPDAPDDRIGGGAKCSATLSCTRIAEFIRKSIEDTCAKHPEAAAHTPPWKDYRAVPVLVYVPLTDDPDADEARAVEKLRADSDLQVFVAEDYQSGVYRETPDDNLPAMIGTVCESM